MNLLITGGCGFIGSNFINNYFQKLLDKTDGKGKLINIDNLYYCSSINNINKDIRNHPNYHIFIGNTGNKDLMKNIIIMHEITHVINFAAQSHVQSSFGESLQYTQDNIVGTHTLLETCRQHLGDKLKRFIHVSTDEVYGETFDDQKHEGSILAPTNPYAATKAGAELIAISYYNSFKMPIIITRGNNVYGPNQFPEKLIPKFIKLLENGQPVTIQGDGSHIRGFLHVKDTCDAFEAIFEKGTIGEIYNIGCELHSEYTVMEITKMLIQKMKYPKKKLKQITEEDYNKWIIYIQDRPFNDKRYFIECSKLKALGWEQKISFDEGITDLVANSSIYR